MKRLLKPLRVLCALGCFLAVDTAFLLPVVARAFFLEDVLDFSWIAALQFGPALLGLNLAVVFGLLALTALVGRVYCSVLCPLGVLQDIAFRLRRLFVRPNFRFAPRGDVRVGVLVATGLAVVGGVSFLAAAFDPYSAFGRVLTDLVRPLVQLGLNRAAEWSEANETYWLTGDAVLVPTLAALVSASLTLIVVVSLAVWRGRWICNHLCPVGLCLGLAAKRPLARLRIDPAKCVGCGLCEKGCKAGAIEARTKTLDNARCVRCFNCLSTCRKGAIGR